VVDRNLAVPRKCSSVPETYTNLCANERGNEVSDFKSAVDAFKHSFDTGDRGPFEAMLAPGCLTWHNSDKLEIPTANPEGSAIFQQLVEGAHADIVQHETLPAGELIRLVLRGTVRSTGLPLEAHNCIVLTIDDSGITRVDEYVDPTLRDQLVPHEG
jgi:ketosteroid isomerase-like protein